MSKKILVTGVTGSGKTTLEHIFHQKGYQTSDIDRGLAEWRYKDSDKPLGHYPRNEAELSLVYWSLKVKDLKERLDANNRGDFLVFGSTNDLYKYVGLFTKIFLLEYPDGDTLVERLKTRPEDDYGKTDHERDAALGYYLDYQTKMKELGAEAIDCRLPIDEVVKIIQTEIDDD